MKVKVLLFTITMVLISVSIFAIGPDRLYLLYYKVKNGSSFEFNNKLISVREYIVVGNYIDKGQLALSSSEISRYDPVILNLESPIPNIYDAVDLGFLKPSVETFSPCKLYEINFKPMLNKYLMINEGAHVFYTLDKAHIKKISLENLCLAVTVTKIE